MSNFQLSGNSEVIEIIQTTSKGKNQTNPKGTTLYKISGQVSLRSQSPRIKKTKQKKKNGERSEVKTVLD